MDITPVIPKHKYVIEGYGAGGFKLAGDTHEGSLRLSDSGFERWNAKNFADIDYAALEKWCIAQQQDDELPELLLIGTGVSFQQLPPEFIESIKKQKLALEVMDTGAACRTYNILLSEQRRVIAAFIAV